MPCVLITPSINSRYTLKMAYTISRISISIEFLEVPTNGCAQLYLPVGLLQVYCHLCWCKVYNGYNTAFQTHITLLTLLSTLSHHGTTSAYIVYMKTSIEENFCIFSRKQLLTVKLSLQHFCRLILLINKAIICKP